MGMRKRRDPISEVAALLGRTGAKIGGRSRSKEELVAAARDAALGGWLKGRPRKPRGAQ